MARPRVAVIGTNIGSTLHVRALQTTGFDVVALVGRDAERTKERAAHFGIPLATTSVERALESGIDAVVVATPPASHYPIVMAAIKAGIHILCEKPLAATATLAAEMRDAARAAGVIHLLQHQLRWSPSNALLRRLVRQGALGTLIQGAFDFDVPMMHQPEVDVPDWWLSPETGGGWLRNWNTHGIDLVRYMIGEFGAVSGRLHADPARGMASDDSYVMNFVLTNGLQGVMVGTCRAWYPATDSRVIGANATAVLQGALKPGGGLLLANKDGVQEMSAPQDLLDELFANAPGAEKPPASLPPMGAGVYAEIHAHQPYREQISLCTAFARRLKDPAYTNPAFGGFDDGVVELRVVEAVERAHREQRWIDLA